MSAKPGVQNSGTWVRQVVKLDRLESPTDSGKKWSSQQNVLGSLLWLMRANTTSWAHVLLWRAGTSQETGKGTVCTAATCFPAAHQNLWAGLQRKHFGRGHGQRYSICLLAEGPRFKSYHLQLKRSGRRWYERPSSERLPVWVDNTDTDLIHSEWFDSA